MAANPGHYVAAVIPADNVEAARATKRRLKLLRPDDTLALGGVYRLVSFEEVLREFVSKRHATLTLSRMAIAAAAAAPHRPEPDSSLAMEQAALPRPDQETANGDRPSDQQPEPDLGAALMVLGGRLGLARHGQWRPALPSIAEGSAVC